MPIVHLNGQLLPEEQAQIPVTDRGFLFGDGVYRSDENHRQRFDKMRPQEHFGRQSVATAPHRGKSSEGNAARIIPPLGTTRLHTHRL